MEKSLKIILAILLLLCLLDMPYGYYQFVRFAATVGFAYLAYSANEQNRKNDMFINIALALLFQPFIKIALGRTIWNLVDFIVGIGVIISLFKKKQQIKALNDKKQRDTILQALFSFRQTVIQELNTNYLQKHICQIFIANTAEQKVPVFRDSQQTHAIVMY